MSATLPDLLSALHRKTGFECVESSDAVPNRIRIMGRVRDDPRGIRVRSWNQVARALCIRSKTNPNSWTVDISKKYDVFGDDHVFLWAYRLIFQGQDIKSNINDIVRVVLSVEISQSPNPGMVDEFPLAGAHRGDNGDLGRGKGAFAVDTAPIGVNLRR